MKQIKQEFCFEGQGLIPWVDLGVGRCQKSHFSEYGHVEYQIEGKEANNNRLANILPLYRHH